MKKIHNKIQDIFKLSGTLKTHKQNGQKTVLCHGVFDLLHIGHIKYFEEASKVKVGVEKSDDRALINLANAYRRKGDDEKAIQIYGKILSNNFYPGIFLKQATTLPIVYRDRSHIIKSRQLMINQISSISKESLSLSDPALEISSTSFFLAYQAMPNRDLQEKISQINTVTIQRLFTQYVFTRSYISISSEAALNRCEIARPTITENKTATNSNADIIKAKIFFYRIYVSYTYQSRF